MTETPLCTKHPKIQIYTVNDYFDGRLPNLPQINNVCRHLFQRKSMWESRLRSNLQDIVRSTDVSQLESPTDNFLVPREDPYPQDCTEPSDACIRPVRAPTGQTVAGIPPEMSEIGPVAAIQCYDLPCYWQQLPTSGNFSSLLLATVAH